jgi:TPR repeat protein
MVNKLQEIREMIDLGQFKKAYKALLPLLAENNSEAQFLYSTFSLLGKETIEEFEARSISLLQAAAEAEYPPAMYALGVCCDVGDMVAPDPNKASILFKKAAEAGYSKAKLSHGLDLFYGSNKIKKDEVQGLSLLEQAVADNVDGAAENLEQIKDERKKRGMK